MKLSRRAGGAFSVGHDLKGRTLATTKDRRIVQSWRANNWLTFTQTGVPSVFYKEISTGWRDYYWTSLRRTFAKAR